MTKIYENMVIVNKSNLGKPVFHGYYIRLCSIIKKGDFPDLKRPVVMRA